MKKKKVNYKSVIVVLLAVAVGLFLGNKLAYYQMYRLQINHEKTLSIALTAITDEEALQDNQASSDETEDDEEISDTKIAETDITVFTNEEPNPADSSAKTEDSPADAAKTADTALININTADKATLDTLPNIGEVKAQAIIDYRNKYGKFLSTEEIMNVNGIGEKTYEDLKDLICVD